MRLAGLLLLAACGGTPDPAPPPSCDPPDLPRREFRSSVTPRLGSPRHVAPDVVVPVGQPYQLRAKLTYGKLRKDLEDEVVGLVLGEGACGPWERAIDAVTDDDGWAVFERPALDRAVVRPFHVIVYGDGSRTTGGLWAIEPGTRAVLFDVDGTLTTGDGELMEDLLGGSAPDMRPGADDVARRWAELGYLVVYITGRHHALRTSTRTWLDNRAYPRGPLFTPKDPLSILPTRGHVGAYKLETIRALIAAGLEFEAAYGNASTDVCAYAEAGIPPERTWITERRDPCDGHAAPHDLPSYVDHLPTLADYPRAD